MSAWSNILVRGLAMGCAVVVVACAPVPPSPVEATSQVPAQPPAPSAPEVVTEERLMGSAWQLQLLPGIATLRAPLPSLQFLGLQQVQGSDGCNRFAAKASISAQGARFTDMRATLMACMPAAPGQEDRFFLALERARSIRLLEGRLQLLDPAGQLLAEFRR